jgi:small-conductance mechanosensitive channel
VDPTSVELLALAAAAGAAAGAHALLRRAERRLPLWLARRRGPEPAPQAVGALRRGVARAVVAAKLVVWIALAAFASQRLPSLMHARDGLAGTIAHAARAPLVRWNERPWSALDLLVVPLLLLALWLGIGLAIRALRWQLARSGALDEGAGDGFASVARWGLTAAGGVIALQAAGVDVSSLAVFGGVLGVGIGFGLQNLTSNFVSGLQLSVERPIRPGDFVTLGPHAGTVVRVGGRATEIRTRDHVTVLVPNAKFLEGELVNWSHGSPVCRLHVPVGVAYGSDLARARAVLLAAARAHPGVLADPRPRVEMRGFGDSALLLELLVWTCDPAAQQTTTSDLLFAIDAGLRRHGISVPFPQRDLHLRSPSLDRLVAALGARAFPELAEAPAPAPAEPDVELAPDATRDPALWSGAELDALAARLRGPGGVAIADRRHRLRVHRRCFVGRDAVRWLVEREAVGRDEAIALGRRLVARGLLRHVLDEHDFEDAPFFYRFREDDDEAASAA